MSETFSRSRLSLSYNVSSFKVSRAASRAREALDLFITGMEGYVLPPLSVYRLEKRDVCLGVGWKDACFPEFFRHPRVQPTT